MAHESLNDLHLLLEVEHAGAVHRQPIFPKSTAKESIERDAAESHDEDFVTHLDVMIGCDIPYTEG